MKKILYLIAVSAALFTACKKGTLVENTVYEKLEPGDPKYSYIKVLNLTPGSPVVNFYMNGAKFSASQSTSGVENAGYAYNGLFPDLGYAVVKPGANTLTAKVIPTAADPNLEVFNTQIKPEAGKYYTLVTFGQYDATTKKIPSSLMLQDARPALDTSKIYVRFANMFIGSSKLNLVQENGEKLMSNVDFGTASEWVSIPNPGKTNKYFIYDSGTNNPMSTAFSVTLVKGRAYTLYTRGIVGNANFPLNLTFYTTFY